MEREEEQPLLSSEKGSGGTTKYATVVDTKDENKKNDRPNYVPKCPITVEPFMFLYFFALMGFSPLMTQYLYKRLGEDNQSHSTNISHCDQNTSDPYYIAQQKTQAEASEWSIYFSITCAIPSMVVTVFYGAYSDKAGRKLCLILPAIGSLLRQGGTLAIIYFNWPLYCLLPAYFVEGLFGYFTTAFMGCFSYIADISTAKNKAIKIVIGEACSMLAAALSEIVIGYLIKLFPDFSVPTVVTVGSILLALLYAIFFIPELIEKDPEAKLLDFSNLLQVVKLFFHVPDAGQEKLISKPVQPDQQTPHLPAGNVAPPSDNIQTFPAQHSVSTGSVEANRQIYSSVLGEDHSLPHRDISQTEKDHMVLSAPPGRVWKLRMLILILFLIAIPMISSTVDTLYVLNLPFCWTSEKIGWYNAIRIMIIQLASMVGIVLMRKVFKLSEVTVAMVALLSYISSKIIIAFAQYDYMMYVGASIGALSLLSIAMLRAAMSQLVTHHEQGALFASISLVESVCTLLGNTILNSIYAATVAWFRGYVYCIMSGLCLIALIILGIYQFKTLKRKSANTTSKLAIN
ncbi:solute carrier family 46 member 3 [Lingula anatina]|uniref:Solute carrier family 46 member 3 n=1 Tax=Lingula anatina TaxID=7574 RepID=A0A1S3J6T3_LINAN|nr:solute carrier family 46 member 3 [Lingula anatina]|eukprot:XP_013406018.1 solute carrier family 46 member 3 [Lingula anatina]